MFSVCLLGWVWSQNLPFQLSSIRNEHFSLVRVARFRVFCVVFCRLLFVLLSFFFLSVIVRSVLFRFMTSDYPFGIFNFTQKTRARVAQTPINTGGELRCSVMVHSSGSTCGNRGVTLVTSLVNNVSIKLYYC
jgi:hypothetical protein